MGKYDKLVQSAAEKLIEDERLRSNLTDEEANLLVDWAIRWLEDRLARVRDEATARQIAQAEVTRLRPAMYKINDSLAGGKMPTLSAAIQALGLPRSRTATNPLDRMGLIRALTTRLAEAWRKQ